MENADADTQIRAIPVANEQAVTPNDDQDGKEAGIANLPYARGKTFKTLDEYLAHLEKNGTIDLPYWREISPGVYEWTVRMPEAERKTATREELLALYGFER